MDSSRSHDPRLYRAAPPNTTYPYGQGAQPPAPKQPAPQRTSPSVYPYEQRQTPSSTYPYEQPAPRQPAQQQPSHPQQPRQAPKRTSPGRRLLGVAAFLVLTGLSIPIDIAAVFFVYVTFESPGDALTAVLIVSGAFLGVFAALLVTGIVAQVVGGFPGKWRARVTFAVLSGVLALGTAYIAALFLF